MSFYDLSKNERTRFVANVHKHILNEFESLRFKKIITYFEDEDTYIRKSAYLCVGKVYLENKKLQSAVIELLNKFLKKEDYKIRQTAINAAGEIGKKDFSAVEHFFKQGLFDQHSSPRNAVIGSIKKMSEVNPKPVLKWAAKYIRHDNPEIRRQIGHGIELRGRKHPEDILPLLKILQHDKVLRVRNTLVHVLGQIAYKKGCLEIVVQDLKTWKNQELVADALKEIIDVHYRYRNFSHYNQEQARHYIEEQKF